MKILIFILFLSSNVLANLVEISTVDNSIRKDIRYFSHYNFVGTKIDGYKAAKCFLEEKTARALSDVQNYLLDQGYSLLVYDCYRPQKAVDHFVRWSQSEDRKMKTAFYPTLKKENLFDLGYIAKKSGHTTGRTVDLTIINSSLGPLKYSIPKEHTKCFEKDHFDDHTVDMGGAYDCFHEVSHTENMLISKEHLKNRMILKQAMEKFGFKNYSKEWWHYSFVSSKSTRYKQDVE